MNTHPCQGLYDQLGKALEEWSLYSKRATLVSSDLELDPQVDVVPILITDKQWEQLEVNATKRDAAKERVMELQEKISHCQEDYI